MKIYAPNKSKSAIGGGWTFLRNFKKALKDKATFVETWQECDIIFVFGVTAIDKTEIHNAVQAGKKLVLRVDNIPKKSRNRRQDPAARLEELGKIASAVVYQSKWCKDYAGYFAGDGVIINNGVDTEIFNRDNRKSDGKTFLYINYNNNPNKRFEEALYRFEMIWREDEEAHLVIGGKPSSEYLENPEYNWDLNVPAKVEYAGILESPQAVAEIMKQCDYILYPSFAEAYPNTLLEALACGVEPLYINEEGGSEELIDITMHNGIKTIQQMGDEYLALFETCIKN